MMVVAAAARSIVRPFARYDWQIKKRNRKNKPGGYLKNARAIFPKRMQMRTKEQQQQRGMQELQEALFNRVA